MAVKKINKIIVTTSTRPAPYVIGEYCIDENFNYHWVVREFESFYVGVSLTKENFNHDVRNAIIKLWNPHIELKFEESN